MARYVDGYLIPIKKKNINAYKKMARLGCKVWMKYGALDYYECIGDEIRNNPWGIPFAKLCKLKSDETVVFAYIVYKSKAHRNQVNKKVHLDSLMQPNDKMAMPFDIKRFSVGGFRVAVSNKK